MAKLDSHHRLLGLVLSVACSGEAVSLAGLCLVCRVDVVSSGRSCRCGGWYISASSRPWRPHRVSRSSSLGG